MFAMVWLLHVCNGLVARLCYGKVSCTQSANCCCWSDPQGASCRLVILLAMWHVYKCAWHLGQ